MITNWQLKLIGAFVAIFSVASVVAAIFLARERNREADEEAVAIAQLGGDVAYGTTSLTSAELPSNGAGGGLQSGPAIPWTDRRGAAAQATGAVMENNLGMSNGAEPANGANAQAGANGQPGANGNGNGATNGASGGGGGGGSDSNGANVNATPYYGGYGAGAGSDISGNGRPGSPASFGGSNQSGLSGQQSTAFGTNVTNTGTNPAFPYSGGALIGGVGGALDNPVPPMAQPQSPQSLQMSQTTSQSQSFTPANTQSQAQTASGVTQSGAQHQLTPGQAAAQANTQSQAQVPPAQVPTSPANQSATQPGNGANPQSQVNPQTQTGQAAPAPGQAAPAGAGGATAPAGAAPGAAGGAAPAGGGAAGGGGGGGR